MTGLTMRRLTTPLAAAFLFAALASVSHAALTPRVAHTATLLSSGDILIAGGVDAAGNKLGSSELFLTSVGNTSVTTDLGLAFVARASHTATLLPNGCVLAVGGNTAASDAVAPVASNSAQIYNPATGAWGNVTTGPQTTLLTARINHTATLLNDGRVLICGGEDGTGTALDNPVSNVCEFYTPGATCTEGDFTAAPNLLQSRYNHTATLLKDGKVWFTGGANPAVVATGGYLVTTERFNPGTGAMESASPMIEARAHHTATLMGDGKVLVIGGFNGRNVLANRGITESAEIYDPIANNVTPAAAMESRRMAHATVLSANGEVTLFGGLGNITTTFLTPPISNGVDTLQTGSSITFNNPALTNTANVSTGSLRLALDFLLAKPVIGKMQEGEVWLSSPAIRTSWGEINLTTTIPTIPGAGVRINLAGADVYCRNDNGLVAGNCGNIAGNFPVSQLAGNVVFFTRGITYNSTVTGGNLSFAPTPVNSGSVTANLTPAGSNFTANVTIAMDNAFIGKTVSSGTINLVNGTLVQFGTISVVLNGGKSTIPTNTVVGTDAFGNGSITFGADFRNLTGVITYTGDAGGANFSSGDPIPIPGNSMSAAGTCVMNYTTTGANLATELFSVDKATVVVRKMIFADAETYNPKANSWTLAPPGGVTTAQSRYGHSATLLPNNDKVFIGGRICSGVMCAAQTANANPGFQLLYSEKNFAATAGAAAQRRAFHTSTLLPSGDILVVGGTNGPSILRSAELFTPATETFSPVNNGLNFVRDLHTATLLPNGRVLVAGGFTTNSASTGSTNTAEIYYPDTKRFIETSPMISSRSNHTAIMLPDGRVFVAGGYGVGDVITGTSEIFISTQSRWIAAATMPAGCQRAIHAAVQLKSGANTGKIMLIGGVDDGGPMSSSALYDPVADTWDCASVPGIGVPAVAATFLRSHSATLLFDGRVLVAGGNDGLGEANVSFIYNPVSNVWSTTSGSPLLFPRFNHTATLLPNDTVMITGGSQRFGNVPPSIEIYHLNGSSWVTGGLDVTGMKFFGGPRAFHTMTLGLNNVLYGIGGSDGVIGGAGVSLYTSAEAGYFTATPDNFSKDAPPSFRQSVITGTSATPFLPGTNLTVTGIRFRGGTEAAGGGAASANSSFSFPHLVMQQIEGSGGAASQSNGGFAVDLTTEIFLNPANGASLDTSLTVPVPPTSTRLPFGWYTVRTGANDLYSNATLLQVGPAKPTLAPANVTGVAAGISSMVWTWNSIPGVDGYNIYNATTNIFISSIPVTVLPQTTFYQTSLAPNATASIIIAGYTLSGDGPLTNSPTSYTLSTTPVNVAITSVTFFDLQLIWGANGNTSPGTTYEVSESSDNFVNNFSTPVPQLFQLATTFTTISNLSANTTYYFRVRAYNSNGTPSPFSVIVSTLTRAPANQPVISSRTTTTIIWNWVPTPFVNNYRVYNATNNVLLASPAVSSFTQTGLGINTEHSIYVTAVTGAGEGPVSAPTTGFTMAASPGIAAPPISLLTTGSFLLNWTNNGNPPSTRYEYQIVEYDVFGTSQNVAGAILPPLVFSVGVADLDASSFYTYGIRALNGEGIPSDDPAVVIGSTYTLPNVPVPSLIGTSPTTISLNWSANGNGSSTTYQVTISSDNFFSVTTAVPFSSNFTGTSFVIPGLVTGATYEIQVEAANAFGQVSGPAPLPALSTRTFNGGAPVGSIQGTMLFNSDSTLFGSLGNGRQINLRAPAHTFPSDVVVTISSFVPAGTLCPGATSIAFSITNSPALQPIGSLYFSFGFLPAELGTIPSSRALLLRYDPGSGTCVPLETVVDNANNQMTARINHFSLFQVGQAAPTNTAETARIFPNPYYASRDGYVTIDNVPAGARVRIFTLRGEQVLDVKANTAGLLTWSGTNGSGRTVASGVYLVMVEFGGSKKVLKLAVIR